MGTFKPNFNNTNPPALPGHFNVEWQVSDEYDDPTGGTLPYRDLSAAYQQGGVDARTTTGESVNLSQRGQLVTFNNSSAVACTFTTALLPLGLMMYLENLGAGAVTITPSAGLIDGAASFVLTTKQGIIVFWDGTNLQVFRGFYTPPPNFADAEVPTGTVNGSNVTFTLAHAPSPAASLQLFVNGVLMKAGGVDYTLSGLTITFVSAPATSSVLESSYRY